MSPFRRLLQIGAKFRRHMTSNEVGTGSRIHRGHVYKNTDIKLTTEQRSLIKHCVDIKMNPTETYDFLSKENSKMFTGLSLSPAHRFPWISADRSLAV